MTPETAAKSALTEALARVQAKLPEVRKGETAQVKSDKGSYSYRYADLAAITKAVLPLLAEHGLAWVTRPTLVEGRLVLVYALRHVSGEEIAGEYPLAGGTPQQIGSAITYARRYCLCSVTGVAPESDDDDAAAASHRGDEWETAQPHRPRQQPEREQIVARAREAIAAADNEPKLAALRERVAKREHEGAITAEDAIELRRLIVRRMDELFPAGEAQAAQAVVDLPVTQKQHKRMHALWREVGLGGEEHREARLTRTSLIVGRDIDSSAQLTAVEADSVIDTLDAEVKAQKAEAPA